MRKLKMLTGLSGPEVSLAPGDECEFDDDQAERLINAGFAEAAEPKKVEPKKVEPKKAEPKKAEPKKAEPKS